MDQSLLMKEFQLRKWELSDAESLTKHANNKDIAHNLSDFFPHPYHLQDAVGYIESTLKGSSIVRAIVVNGEACGGIGLHPKTDIFRRNAEIGYWIGEKHWGKGIISEAIVQMIPLGFGELDIDRIYADTFSQTYLQGEYWKGRD